MSYSVPVEQSDTTIPGNQEAKTRSADVFDAARYALDFAEAATIGVQELETSRPGECHALGGSCEIPGGRRFNSRSAVERRLGSGLHAPNAGCGCPPQTPFAVDKERRNESRREPVLFAQNPRQSAVGSHDHNPFAIGAEDIAAIAKLASGGQTGVQQKIRYFRRERIETTFAVEEETGGGGEQPVFLASLHPHYGTVPQHGCRDQQLRPIFAQGVKPMRDILHVNRVVHPKGQQSSSSKHWPGMKRAAVPAKNRVLGDECDAIFLRKHAHGHSPTGGGVGNFCPQRMELPFAVAVLFEPARVVGSCDPQPAAGVEVEAADPGDICRRQWLPSLSIKMHHHFATRPNCA
ncbi:MAG TPA: hypothetical protein VHD62_16135 [Opitutaceae bacterium]|nr:hypothetical protein [Opitutaceae bacterium]